MRSSLLDVIVRHHDIISQDNNILNIEIACFSLFKISTKMLYCVYHQGFEDCTILHELIHKHGGNLDAALAEYTETRNKDAAAICDLAMYNYVEVGTLNLTTLLRSDRKI